MLGLTATIVHLLNHALAKGALFMAIGCIRLRLGSVSLRRMGGIARQMPWTMAAFVLGCLSLVGIPGTAGFISKWYLVLAALEVGLWPVAIVIVLVSLVALVYLWRVVEVAYFAPAPNGRRVSEAPLWMLVPTWIVVLANYYFGLHAGLAVSLAKAAAHELLTSGVVPTP
jgi:multicomponent Na+:H+ antiporter subunit D